MILSASPWFIGLCLLVGAGYAALLYSAKAPWGRLLNYALAAVRFVVVSFLCFLLLSPFLKSTSTTTEAPTVVLAVDDSQSVGLFTPPAVLTQATQGLARLAESLRGQGFRVETRTLTAANRPVRPDSLRFQGSSTDLDRLLTGVGDEYEGRNLASVVLVSDGLVNQGRAPQFADYRFPIYAVGVGDTVPKRDLSLPALIYNRVAFSGNQFPIEAEIGYAGYAGGTTATAVLRENGRVLQTKRVSLPAGQRRVRTTFLLTAPAPGKRRYEVVLERLPGEFTLLNNQKTAVLDIVKGKLRVLLAGAAPHPDLKALRAAILQNNNFDLTTYLPGISPLKSQDFDVAILHQLPARGGVGQEVLAQVRARRVPALYVLGAQSDFGAYNSLGTGLTVAPRGSQTDAVTPVPNPAFSRFAFEEEALRRFAAYPPAPVPFGELRLGGGAEAALWQQVGRIKTQKPLLVFGGTPQQRQATLLTDGSWQWRLQEAVEHDDQPQAYDRLIIRTLQLLTQNANKKRLDVYPTQDAFTTQDDVTFGAETYNAIFERIYGQQITLTLTDERQRTRTFTYTNSADGAPLHLGPLPAGLYRYVARATLGGQPQQDRGEVLVQDQQLEALQSRADHNLLHQLARHSGQRLYFPQQLDQLAQDIRKANYKPVLYEQESLRELINLKWLLPLLLALLTVEWATRKYSGGI
ncbi:VWA domain-containing protein [Hymenobacter weizhouensis]|uniref:VWA domain-containing protein n=1 Tax=Hymenobacter sp. YIM 151500-1 TaxID=2987689 RepID=UPI002226F930|nr:VWA domain-containing protein [Hymenobacter sp. YIM 151500-1]UYZ65018.1 VWA domain-containing protein [Hymenobacter sp. YIM 151500-1]